MENVFSAFYVAELDEDEQDENQGKSFSARLLHGKNKQTSCTGGESFLQSLKL